MSAVNVESGKAAGGGAGGPGGAGDDGMNDLYKVNQVYYRMLPTLSLVSKRTLLVNQAQNNSYQGTSNPVIFNFNTGEFYTAMNSSWLYIQCGWMAPATYGTTKALISQGNILSLIEEIIFTSASGTEVERQTNKGLHSAITFRWTHDQVYIDTIGQIQGAPYGPFFKNHDGVAPSAITRMGGDAKYTAGFAYPNWGGSDFINLPRSGPGSQNFFGVNNANLNVYATVVDPNGASTPTTETQYYPEFAVPLDQILGVFKPYMNCLFPAGLLSGGRLEIRWKRTSESIHFVGTMNQTDVTAATPVAATADTLMNAFIAAADNAFIVNKIYIVFDAFQLQDNVLKRLNQTAAGPDGLSMLFDTYDHVITNQAGSGQCECQVSQARSRVVRSFNVVRDAQLINNPYVNSFASEAAVRRVSGLVPVGMIDQKAHTAVTGGTGVAGISGGLTLTNLLDTANTGGTPVLTALPVRPALPDDPYGSTGTADKKNTNGLSIVRSYQAQLGALFFPQQPITTLPEHYMNALYLWGQGIPDSRVNCSVTYEDFLGGVGNYLNRVTNDYTMYQSNSVITDPTQNVSWKKWVAPWGLAVYGALMEKSQALQLSGLPLSNARLLRHKFDFRYPSISNQRQISTFTQFTRVVKVFLGGRVVVRE